MRVIPDPVLIPKKTITIRCWICRDPLCPGQEEHKRVPYNDTVRGNGK